MASESVEDMDAFSQDGSPVSRYRNETEEAEEDRNVIQDDSDVPEEEGEGEDLLGEDMFKDYIPVPSLDAYNAKHLDDDVRDDRDLDEIARDKRRAEKEMDERDRKRRQLEKKSKRRRLPSILRDRDETDDSDDEEAEEDGEKVNESLNGEPLSQDQSHTERRFRYNYESEDMNEYPEDSTANYEEDKWLKVQGNLREWVAKDEVIRFIRRRFRNFLKSFRNSKGEYEYTTRINDMVELNKCSLEVDYTHFLSVETILSVWLADVPKLILEQLEKVAYDLVLKLHPKYFEFFETIHIRVTNLPIVDCIRNIRKAHLNTLVKVGGVVTRRTSVFPQLQQVKYNCEKCHAVIGPFFQNSNSEIKIMSCIECQSKGPFSINVEQTIYRNYQKITIQESPGSIPAGRLPRHKEVILLDDLIDCAKPGEEIEVTGIYMNNFDSSLNFKNGFAVFSTLIEANHISKKLDEFSVYKLNDDDKNEIISLSQDPRIAQRIIKSIAPSIYGHENIKTAIALAMFGGVEKNVSGKHRLRGDINLLLLGDPGTAKSQFLKYVEKTAPRAVYTTGKGASAVGLTASVHKDPLTKEWTLEGGALVLADRGVCLIDEFDKMNDQDRVSIHEAMEQQSISISKAGIITSLQARCSVIAAANPLGGRYDSSKTFSQNVELTDPILSRFDTLIVIRDTVDPVLDEMLAKFVVESHHKSHPDNTYSMEENFEENRTTYFDSDVIPQSLLKKYMAYAKQNIHPKLHEADLEKIATVYADLRRESSVGHGTPMAVRHIESMIRMAEAHAKMHLRSYVSDEDVDMAIRVLLESFISTQKFSVQKSLQRNFRKYMTYKRDYNELLLYLLRQLVKEVFRYVEIVGRSKETNTIKVKVEDFEAKAREYNIMDVQPFFSSVQFDANGFSLDDNRRHILHSLVERDS